MKGKRESKDQEDEKPKVQEAKREKKRVRKVGMVKSETSESESQGQSSSAETSSNEKFWDVSKFRIKEVGKNRLTWPRIGAIFELVDEEQHFILDLEVNGFKMECLLDTGSPISIRPQLLRDNI